MTTTPEQSAATPKALGDARRRLADEASRAKRPNALRAADTRLQRADSKYASRADSNLAHFLLARPDTSLDANAYAQLVLTPGSDLNAPGVYAWYHLSALQKASRLANEQLSADERRALARAAPGDEAFALHFLEDMYAAGHVAGSWGDVSQRKGTHDFYDQNGLEVFTWKGRERTIVLTGDAHIRLGYASARPGAGAGIAAAGAQRARRVHRLGRLHRRTRRERRHRPADHIGTSRRRLVAALVPGFEYDCFASWLDSHRCHGASAPTRL